MFARQLITQQKRYAGSFAKKHTPLPVADQLFLIPSRVRAAHYTDAEIAALPKPIANPNLNKNKYLFLFPFFIPGGVAWSFYIFNNYTQIYNDRVTKATPFNLYE